MHPFLYSAYPFRTLKNEGDILGASTICETRLLVTREPPNFCILVLLTIEVDESNVSYAESNIFSLFSFSHEVQCIEELSIVSVFLSNRNTNVQCVSIREVSKVQNTHAVFACLSYPPRLILILQSVPTTVRFKKSLICFSVLTGIKSELALAL